MKLIEMSAVYREQAGQLALRIHQLRCEAETLEDEHELYMLRERIRTLVQVRREAMELALVTGRYYERGYRRNDRYSV